MEGQHNYNAVPFPPLGWRMLILKGPEKISSCGFHGVEGFSVGPAEKNYRCYNGWIPRTGAEQISDTVMFFPPRKYTYDIPAPPIQEEVVKEAAKALGGSLRTLATKNPSYTHLSNFSGFKKNSDIINSATKKALDSSRKDRG